jgi:hypothetical protein
LHVIRMPVEHLEGLPPYGACRANDCNALFQRSVIS